MKSGTAIAANAHLFGWNTGKSQGFAHPLQWRVARSCCSGWQCTPLRSNLCSAHIVPPGQEGERSGLLQNSLITTQLIAKPMPKSSMETVQKTRCWSVEATVGTHAREIEKLLAGVVSDDAHVQSTSAVSFR
eukprot:4430747-Prymnesium_polylepis.2